MPISRQQPDLAVRPGHNWFEAVAPLALAALLLAFPQIFTLPYPQHVAILIYMNALMAVAWNILGGYTGQVALGNSIFFGIGAYSSALLMRDLGVSPWIGMLVGIAISIVAAVVLGYSTFRLRGYYFTIACIAMAEIALIVVLNSPKMGGAVGVSLPIAKSSLANLQFHGGNKAGYYYLILMFLAIAMLTVYKIENSKWGFYFRAIREDEDGARALGINPVRYKMLAFIFSAVFTTIAGVFYASYVLYIDPYSVLSQQISLSMCLMAVLGGVGTLWGPVIGSGVLIGISEVTRITMGGTGQAIDMMIYGLLVMIFAVFQPKGLMGMWSKLKAKSRERTRK